MKNKDSQLLTGFFVILFLIILIRNAWITDDAYISFRVIENFVAGYGLTFNPSIRVQVYTHPLWVLLISAVYFVQTRLLDFNGSNGLYLLVIFLSIFISGVTIYIVLNKITRNTFTSKLLFCVAVISSKAFIDYSTSGLENTLTYFLLIIFFFFYLKEEDGLFELTLSAAFLAVNRLDTILLVLPALIFRVIYVQKSWTTKLRELVLGFSPLFLWELFSLFYYGFLFPNTAYAKLNTGIPKISLMAQGVDYFINSITFDPVTLLVVAFAGVGIFIEKEKKAILAYIGVLLYLAYIIFIGGDFMAGRFLAAPFLIATIFLARITSFSNRTLLTGLAVILLISAYTEHSPIKSITAANRADKNILAKADEAWVDEELIGKNGIADEKTFYFERSGLTEYGVRDTKGGSIHAGKKWIYTGTEEFIVEGALGLSAYQRGPNTYVIDHFALADPLLARLPVENKVDWRIGHFARVKPKGYLETLETGETLIEDPHLAQYYQKLSYVISGPLWEKQRLIEILKFNTRQYDYLIEIYLASPEQ